MGWWDVLWFCGPAGVLVPVALQEREGKGGHDLCVRGLLKCAGLSRGSTGGCRRPPGVCVGAQCLPTGSPYCAAPSDTGIPGDEGRTDGRVQRVLLRCSRGLQLLSRSQLFFLSFFFHSSSLFFTLSFFFTFWLRLLFEGMNQAHRAVRRRGTLRPLHWVLVHAGDTAVELSIPRYRYESARQV